MSYDACGRTAGMSFPGGAQRSLVYNLAGRLIADSVTSAPDGGGNYTGWQTFYGYDQAGNRIAQTRPAAAAVGDGPAHPRLTRTSAWCSP